MAVGWACGVHSGGWLGVGVARMGAWGGAAGGRWAPLGGGREGRALPPLGYAGWAAQEQWELLSAVSHRRGRGRGPYLVGKLTVGLGYHWHTYQPGPRVLRHT